MTTDDAIRFVQARGFLVYHLHQKTTGVWAARLCDPKRAKERSGQRGFNDGYTEMAEGKTAAEAIMNSARLRIDAETGAVKEITLEELRGYSEEAEEKLGAALDRLLAILNPATAPRPMEDWGPGFPADAPKALLCSNLKSKDYMRLLSALDRNTEAADE